MGIVFTAIGNSEFGMGQLLPRLDDVNCMGSEGFLLNCSHEIVKDEFVCTHYNDAGVVCYNGKLELYTSPKHS